MEKNPIYEKRRKINSGTWRMNCIVPDVADYDVHHVVVSWYRSFGVGSLQDFRKREANFSSKNPANLGRAGRGRGWPPAAMRCGEVPDPARKVCDAVAPETTTFCWPEPP